MGLHPGVVELLELGVVAVAVAVGGEGLVVEGGIAVVLVHQSAHAVVDAVVCIHLGQGLHDLLALVGDGHERPVLLVGADLALVVGYEAGPHPVIGSRGAQARAQGPGDGAVDLGPVGQLGVVGPPAGVAGFDSLLGEGHELVHGRGHLALVDLLEDGGVVGRHARKGGIGAGRERVDGIRLVLVAGVHLVVHLVLVGVDDLVEDGVALRLGVDDGGDVIHRFLLGELADLGGLAPGGEEVGRHAHGQLGGEPVVIALNAGVVFQSDVYGLLNGLLDGVVGHAFLVVHAVGVLGETDVDRLAGGVGLRAGGGRGCKARHGQDQHRQR